MEHEKYSYVEALRWLAARYNVEIEETETSPEYKQQQQVADSLYIINGFAQKFFSDTLFNSRKGKTSPELPQGTRVPGRDHPQVPIGI